MLPIRRTRRHMFSSLLLSGLQAFLMIVAVTLLVEHRISAECVIQIFYLLLFLTIVNLAFLSRLRRAQQQEHLDCVWRERLLLQEQERFRSLIELLPQTVFELDSRGNVLYSNQQGFTSAGYTQDEMSRGLNIFQLLIPEDRERARQNLSELFRKRCSQVNSYTIQRKDGSCFPVQIHSTPIVQDREIIGVRGIAIDITERRRTEVELQRHRQHLQELVDERTAEIVQVNKSLQKEVMERLDVQKALKSSDERFRRAILDAPFPIMIHAEDGEVILLSHIWCELTGYSPEDLPNVSAWVSKAYENPGGELRRRIQNLYGINRRVYEGEFEIRTANARTRIWDLSSAPLGKLPDGRRAVISVGVDITGRKQVEKILREKESAIASSINAIVFANLEGILTYINASFLKLWGYDNEEEVLGKPLLDFWQEAEKASSAIDALQQNGSWFGELTAKRKDTSTAIFQLSANMITNEQGRPISMMASFIDITTRKSAEEQIKTSLQEKEVLLQEIHHRVKNNLQVIASMLYLQSKTLQHTESRDLFLDSRNRIKSMALVHESLYQSGNLARIDIAAYIRRLVVNIFRSYRGSSLGIVPTIKTDDISLSTEAAIPCGLMINELVSNALKYAFPDRQGEILVEMMKDAQEHIILRISDDGVGFPTDFEERQSSSLGIKLVRSLVDQLDGTISIGSEIGSTFHIEFREPKYRKRI